MIRSCFSSNAISCLPSRRIFLSPRMRSSAAGMTSGSIRFGMWPSRPISTALSVPWPRPVSASEPNTSARTRATCGRRPPSSSHFCAKRHAARIGPDGVRGTRPDADLEQVEGADCHGADSGDALIPRPPDPACPMRLRLFQRDDCPLCDEALAVLAAARAAGFRAGVDRRRRRAGSALRRRACRCCATRRSDAELDWPFDAAGSGLPGLRSLRRRRRPSW